MPVAHRRRLCGASAAAPMVETMWVLCTHQKYASVLQFFNRNGRNFLYGCYSIRSIFSCCALLLYNGSFYFVNAH